MEKIPSWLRWILFLPAAFISWKLVEIGGIQFIELIEEYPLNPLFFIPQPYIFNAITFIIGPVIFLVCAMEIAPTENKWFRVSLCLFIAIFNLPAIHKLSKIIIGKDVVLYNQLLGIPLWYETLLSIINLIIIGAFVVGILSNKFNRSDNPTH